MNRTTLFTVLFLLALSAAGFFWYRRLEIPAEPGSVSGGDTNRFIRTLAEVRRLRGIDIDTSVFQDRFFQELIPPKEIPRPEAKPGRENPFAPFR